jgi:RNA polymerase sigma factor (sigma-70 family)
MSATGTPDAAQTLLDLLERLGPRLRRILANYRVPAADAEDILQDAVLATLAKWDEIQSKEGWLLITVRNRSAAYRQVKRRNRLMAMDPQFLEDLTEPQPPPQERRALCADIEALLGVLRERERDVLRLRYGFDMSPAEVAAEVGYQPATIRKVVARSLRRVRQRARRTDLRPLRPGRTGG